MTESVRGRRSIPPVQRVEQGSSSSRGPDAGAALLVPVKAFTEAKQRLGSALDQVDRAELARWCAERVLHAAGSLPVHVVCDDAAVAQWATDLGARVIICSESGLNVAVEQGLAALAATGVTTAVVCHGDLPLATSFDVLLGDDLLGEAMITVVPDHRYDGTNALVLPTALSGRFSFHYGGGSFRKHVVEALGHCPTVRVLRVEELAHDLDTPDDLVDPRMEEVRQWLQTNRANRH
jgi:2-phospho-L-lactate guanylyltransferase